MVTMEDPILDEKPKNHRPVVLFLIWLLFTVAVTALGYPRVRTSIEESGVLEVLKNSTADQQTQTNLRKVEVVFVQYPLTYQTFSVQQPRLGGSAYHRGVTLSSSILYVDVSKEYLLSPDLEAARQQIRRTGLAFPRVKDVVILVEGKPLS